MKKQKKHFHPGKTPPKFPPVPQVSVSQQKIPWKYAVLVAAITAITFISSLQNEFVDTWDDQGYVIDNPRINELSLKKIKEIFTNDIWGNYNPLTVLSFGIERLFVGTKPLLYHLDNLLLHMLCTVLVFWFAWLLSSTATATATALLFGIHPMHVESVAWVTERKDVLFGAFYIASMISYVYYIKTGLLYTPQPPEGGALKSPSGDLGVNSKSGKTKYFILTILFFVLSLFSKIQAVTLPLSLFCIDYFLGRSNWKKAIIEKIPLFGLSLVFGFIGIYFLKEMKAFYVTSDIPITDRPFIGTFAFSVYFIKSLIPYKLAAFYPYPDKGNAAESALLYSSFIIVPLLLFILWKSYRSNKPVFFGLFFFFFNIVMMLQILEAGGAFLADRFSYISYTGLFFIYGFYFQKALNKYSSYKAVIFSLAGLYFIILAILSWNRCAIWKNSLSFWNDEVKKYPSVSFSYTNRAGVFIKMDRMDKAVEDFSTFIQLRPQNPEGYYKRGLVNKEMKNFAQAATDFSVAIRLNPRYLDAYYLRADVLTDLNMLDSALQDCKKIIEMDSLNPEAWNTMGKVHFRQGNFPLALRDINRTLRLNPEYKDGYRNRAILHDIMGNPQQALEDFDRHLQRFPADAQAREWRENVRMKTGE